MLNDLEKIDIDWWKGWAAEGVRRTPEQKAVDAVAEAFEQSLYAEGRESFDYRLARFLKSIGLGGLGAEAGEALASGVFEHHRAVHDRPTRTGPHKPLAPPQ